MPFFGAEGGFTMNKEVLKEPIFVEEIVKIISSSPGYSLFGFLGLLRGVKQIK